MYEVVSPPLLFPAAPNEVPAYPLPSPPDTPGSYVTSKSDPSTLIQVGSLHSQVLASNMRSMMPVLMAYGYSRDDLETLVEDCVSLVRRHYVRDKGNMLMIVVGSWIHFLSETFRCICYQA